MQSEEIKQVAIQALEDLKAKDIVSLDVRGHTSVTDFMVIASGTSTRQVAAMAQNVTNAFKEAGIKTLGIEGKNSAEWVLVDAGDVVVHVMLPQTREFYDLERLWGDFPRNMEDQTASS